MVYFTVVAACQLEADINGFTFGNETLIGERFEFVSDEHKRTKIQRIYIHTTKQTNKQTNKHTHTHTHPSRSHSLYRGITLSGGQKARISLARSIYAIGSPASRGDIHPIVLLDDPLSAVDVKVSQLLFDDCICHLLEGCTRILVTHQLPLAQHSDIIMVLDKHGHISNIGSYEQVAHDDVFSKTIRVASSKAKAPKPKRLSVAAFKAVDVNNPATRSLSVEQSQQGSVKWGVYTAYFNQLGPQLVRISLVVVFIAAQVNQMTVDYYLRFWTALTDGRRTDNIYLIIYLILVIAFLALAFTRAFMYMAGAMHASRAMHNKALAGVLSSSMRFFDTQPVGRILNRFRFGVCVFAFAKKKQKEKSVVF